jgi:ferredoxin--NADP+ reductase
MPHSRYISRVVALRRLSESGYELTIERQGLEFEAGRLITIRGRDPTEDRSYTVASGEHDEHLQVLFRLIPAGKLTPQLVRKKPGDPIEFSGPFGDFVVRDPTRPMVFIATGTGVAPCRAYLRTHPGLPLTLVHGVRVAQDLFYREEFEGARHIPCVTREKGAGFHGRVTEFFKTFAFDRASHFHLCGANEMIFDMQVFLLQAGVEESSIFTEAYYYRLHS